MRTSLVKITGKTHKGFAILSCDNFLNFHKINKTWFVLILFQFIKGKDIKKTKKETIRKDGLFFIMKKTNIILD